MSLYSPELDADAAWPDEATSRMNRMYRRQRHIYDGTRRYYLLGRDRLIAGLQARRRRKRAGNRLRHRQKPGAGGPASIPTRDFSASTSRRKC